MNISADTRHIRVEFTLPVPRQIVWKFLTEAGHFSNWLGDHVSIEPKLNGRFREIWFDGDRKVITAGKITAWNPPEKLTMTWADDNWQVETAVTFVLKQAGEETLLIFEHSGWDQFPANQRKRLRDAHKQGWLHYLKRLKEYAFNDEPHKSL